MWRLLTNLLPKKFWISQKMREILLKIPWNSSKNWVKFSFKMSEFLEIAGIPLKAWCTWSIKMTVQKKYQEMQPCHYSECSNIHNPFSNHYPRESIFWPFWYIRSLKMTKKLYKYLRCYQLTLLSRAI